VSRVEIIDASQDSRWDEFSRAHPFGLICHSPGWRNFLEGCFRHIRGYCLVRTTGGGGEFRAGLPVYLVESPVIGRRLVSVPFASLCDPLVSSTDDLNALVGAALDIMHSHAAQFLEIRAMKAAPLLKDGRLGINLYYKTHFLTLEGSASELLKSFDRTCVRQRISRAERSGLDLVKVTDEQGLRQFQNLNFATRKRLGLPPQPYRILKGFWENFYPSGMADFLMAEKDGRAVAGLMVFKFKDRVSAEISVSDTSSQQLSPNHLLFWEAMKEARAAGYAVFDFGRTAPGNSSLMAFKKRWGTEVAETPHYYFPSEISSRVTQRENSPAYKLINRICRSAPDPILMRLGEFIYGHLG
jgi:CelD/BcsL family acetyltransferase involved in cellulose biosynthesis